MRCTAIACTNRPERGSRVEMFNQTVQTKCLRELVAIFTAVAPEAKVEYVENPRKECAENDLKVTGADDIAGKIS